ncbi:zinc finger protein AEBP2 isoform X2 [Zootoca vivipara]|uniref:zinc finger protein AEBP2 isoform X2 n=1 Tax=Zootoca vivipara TaxID=8524 RepID=UPI00293C08F2|nr:zinc finger protein AEBP2 isoform X2 [Zootoca vivipara]
MAAELSDMAEPPPLGVPPPPPSSSSAEEAESEASPSSFFPAAVEMEAEPSPPPLLLLLPPPQPLLSGGEGTESMSEPSPQSASQAGDGDDEDEDDDDDEAGSSAGSSSSSGCCSDEIRSLSPAGSEAYAKGGLGEGGVGGSGGSGGGDGPGSSGGGGGPAAAGTAAAGGEGPSGGGSGGMCSSSSSAGGGDEGYSTGSGGRSGGSSTCSTSSAGRRGSLEISSDGEPLSRMDSEDSISSTIMDVDSTISSGRSTPVMMGGQGVTASSAKSIGYNCCWDECHSCFNSSPDLADHIRSIHVDGQRGGVFVCLWKGCKVYNTPSTSQSWLQRHMLTHSGDKPFKCVVGGCNASFASQSGLARHVPTHFSQQNSSKVTNQPKAKEESPSKAGMNKRRKLKNKRRRSLQYSKIGGVLYMGASYTRKKYARPHDFFDAQTLDAIRHRAICFNLSAHIESLGKGHSVVFHSTVIAKRKEESGKIKLLLHWTPEDILPDVWVNESERHQLKTKVVHLSKLPKDAALLLDPNIYRTMPQKRLKR